MESSNTFTKWANENRFLIIRVTIAVVIAYTICWNIKGEDLYIFLYPWLSHIIKAGPVHAFATPFSNYTPPYLYLMSATSLITTTPLTVIKSLSIVSSAAVAISIRHLLLPSKHANAAMLYVFLLPTIMLNGVFLGQCDGFWAAACLMAVSCALKDRNVAMLAWFGVGVAFKAQAMFLAPFVLLVLLRRRVSLFFWPLPVIVFVLAMVPAWIVGWPARDLATIYLRQAEHFNVISTAPNLWAIVAAITPPAPLPIFWVGFATASLSTALYITSLVRRKLDLATLLSVSLLSAMTIPFLLPKMHERYFFLADMLAFALACVRRDRQSIAIAVAVQTGSVLAYFTYSTTSPAYAIVGGLLNTLAIGVLIRAIRKSSHVDVGTGDALAGNESPKWRSDFTGRNEGGTQGAAT